MKLVDYSSSDGDDTDGATSASPSAPNVASVPLPPLPSFFHDLYSVKPRVGDDPSLHDGRLRGRPHIQGQWATHVYIEYRPSTEQHAILSSVVSKAILRRPQIKSLLFTELGNIAPLHVSLSRPLVLWTHQKDDFLNDFGKTINSLRFAPFELSIRDFACFVNHESTRKFLVLGLDIPQHLHTLAAAVDKVAMTFNQPALYEEPIYHISIAWADMTCDMNDSFFDVLRSEFSQVVSEIKVHVAEVKLKIGNDISTIPLELDSGRNLFS